MMKVTELRFKILVKQIQTFLNRTLKQFLKQFRHQTKPQYTVSIILLTGLGIFIIQKVKCIQDK